MKHLLKLFLLSSTAYLLLACSGGKGTSDGSLSVVENQAAKEMLQGLWVDSETEEISFWAKGDTIYYPDSMSQPTYFAVVGDSLHLVATHSSYLIEKQSEHVFSFRNQNGDIIRLVKSDEPLPDELIRGEQPRVMVYTEVVKTDSVVFYNGARYHWYIAINPTKYKVHTTVYNSDGVEVDNVYYDNIMHVSVFEGARRLFSSDFRKQMFEKKIPGQFLQQSVLSNMEFTGVDQKGFHFVSTICKPDGAACYKAENIISFEGRLTTTLIEF
jgi:hypothetical protein